MKTQYSLHIIGNTLGLSFICIILLVALYEQIFGSALPCPLCFLQRVAYVSAGILLCLNLTRGPKTLNYGLFILASAFGILAAGRQVLLHIMPGDKGFGDSILGLSAYTWNVVVFFIFILFTALALFFQKGFDYKEHKFTMLSKVVITVFVLLIFVNFVSAFLECGFGVCPDNPVEYKYLPSNHPHSHHK